MKRIKNYIYLLIGIVWLGSYNVSFCLDNGTAGTAAKSGADQVSVPLQGRTVIINVTSDKLDYDYDKDEFIATGGAEVVIKEQNSKLEADKVTYDQKNQVVIAENNVKITKNGNITVGSYAKIYLDRESALINDPATFIAGVKIKSKTATTEPGILNAFNGTAIIDPTTTDVLPSKVSANELREWINKQNLPTQDMKIVSKEIDIDRLSDRNIITLKNSTIYVKKLKVATIPKMTFTTDKEMKNVETMLPEIGQNPAMGLYFGPSHVFFLPHGATFKVSPLASFSNSSNADTFGGGVMGRYMSENNETEIGFTTNRDKIMMRGEQKLTPQTKLVYGSNAYMENGFYGNCIARYIAEIVDNRTLANMMNFKFDLRSSAGYSEDYYSSMGTTKFQLQGMLTNPNPIFAYKKDLFQLRLMSLSDISVYGNGDTFGFIGAGPWMDSQIGKLKLSGSYIQSAVYGKSPFLYDQYLPGKSNVLFIVDYKVNNRLNIGHFGSYNLTKDNWEHKLFAENRIYARVGPDNIKFNLSYDLSRKLSRVGVDFLVGGKEKTVVDFDKLKVKQQNKDNI